MTQESVSNKLTELFELYKSGALTKEEYENLKKQILAENDLLDIDKAKIQEPQSTSVPDNPVQEKKGRKIWLFSIIGGVCIIAVVIFKLNLFSTKSDVTDLQEQIVKDIDGNVHHTVKIGTQVWMVENLKTTRYNDGTSIPLVTDNSTWRALTTPAFCWYNNDEITNNNTFGAIYNWYAVNTNKLCPVGWHVPSDSEWTTLTDYLSKNGYGYLGSGDDIGKSLASTTGWNVSSDLGTVGNEPSDNNKSGFTAFASGIRFSNGEFRHSGQNSKWWSSTGTSTTAAQIRFIGWKDGIVTSYSNRKENGFSVRCVKDSGIPEENISVINNPVVESKTAVWDEAIASKIIMDDLNKPEGWTEDYVNYVEEMTHSILQIYELKIGEKEFKVAFAKSVFDGGCPPYCNGIFSVFEFINNQNGWDLNRKSKGFTYLIDDGSYEVYLFSPSDYGIIITLNMNNGKWGEGTGKSLYAYVNNELVETMNYYNEGSDKIDLNTAINSGTSFLQLIKTENGNSSKSYYKFNGVKYEEFQGGITDPALTSMNRFMDVNTALKMNKGICPRCNGTGIEVCNLCEGTGKSKMGEGFECGCVRTYNMELAAGHTPSHPPRKWTCTKCGGTGKYEN